MKYNISLEEKKKKIQMRKISKTVKPLYKSIIFLLDSIYHFIRHRLGFDVSEQIDPVHRSKYFHVILIEEVIFSRELQLCKGVCPSV